MWAAAGLAGLLALGQPAAAKAAETFTFKTVAHGTPDGVRLPAAGPTFQGGRVFGFSSDTTYADGHKETTVGKCSSWTNPPGSAFQVTGVCEAAEYTIRFTCGTAADNPAEANCWGYLEGQAGRYKGRTGLITYRSGTVSEGVGLWH